MPKTKLQERLERERNAALAFREAVYGRMKALNISVAELCGYVDIGTSTWSTRIKAPEEFKVLELKRISDKLEIPFEKIVGLIQ